jgi:hypothetical protein
VSPVKYEPGINIPEDDILHSYSRERPISVFVCTVCKQGRGMYKATDFHLIQKYVSKSSGSSLTTMNGVLKEPE